MTLQDFNNAVRVQEIQKLLARHGQVFMGKDLLEIGSGSGAQLQVLAKVCRSTVGIDVVRSNGSHPSLEIRQYDGRNIPFADASFDIVFSSNVIEHIKDEEVIHREMHR